MNIPLAAPAQRPRRRWWRIILGALALLVAAVAGFWVYTVQSTRSAWAAAEAEAALDTPRWRLLELEADRPTVPDDDDSGAYMMAIRARSGSFNVSTAANYDKIFENLPPQAQLNTQQAELIRTRLALIPRHLEDARKLKDMPRGRYPVTYADDGISTIIPHHQDTRMFAEWLQHDAYLLAHDGEYDKAVDSCRAIMNTGRVVEHDLFLIAFLIRCAMRHISVAALERVLAQGEASEESLRVTQAMVAKEIVDSSWLTAIRGERAMFHHLFVNIRDGKIPAGWMRGMVGGGGSLPESVGIWFADRLPSLTLKYFPEYLHHMNDAVEIAKLPINERIDKIDAWDKKVRLTRNPVIKLATPALSRCHMAECRNQIMLRCAMAALACERYRLKHPQHAWPESLEVLVTERLLGAVPTDPIDKQPLRYRCTKDGVVVYSIGFDKTDNQGKIDNERMLDPGVDIGFRLWNVNRRRQPPLPVIAIEEQR